MFVHQVSSAWRVRHEPGTATWIVCKADTVSRSKVPIHKEWASGQLHKKSHLSILSAGPDEKRRNFENWSEQGFGVKICVMMSGVNMSSAEIRMFRTLYSLRSHCRFSSSHCYKGVLKIFNLHSAINWTIQLTFSPLACSHEHSHFFRTTTCHLFERKKTCLFPIRVSWTFTSVSTACAYCPATTSRQRKICCLVRMGSQTKFECFSCLHNTPNHSDCC